MNLPKSKFVFINKKQIFTSFALIIIGISFYIFASSSNLFSIKKVECYTQFGNCPESYLIKLDTLLHQPIFASNTRKIVNSLLSPVPEIDRFDIYRRIPSVLIVSVKLKSPVGVVSSGVLGSKSLMVDDSGRVYLTVENSSLPVLLIQKTVQEGDSLATPEIQALKIISKVSLMTNLKVYGQLQENILNIRLDSDTEIIIDIKKTDDWDSSLQLLLSRSKITGITPRKIDLRFNNPVVTN